MPILQNVRHEPFAQVRARGARRNDTYEDVGYPLGRACDDLATPAEVKEVRLTQFGASSPRVDQMCERAKENTSLSIS